MKLYKYRMLSTEEDRERAKDILINKRLWFAAPASLNDEDEFIVEFDYTKTQETDELVLKVVQSINPQSTVTREFLQNYNLRKRAKEIFNGIYQQSRSEIGLVCLSQNRNADRLWKEYANNGNGICIEIEVPDKRSNDETLFNVNYVRKKRLHVDLLLKAFLNDRKATKDVYRKIVLTKTKKWAYENEKRMLGKRQNEFWTLNKEENEIISEVIIGKKVPDHIKKEISDCAHKQNIKTSVV